MQTKSGIKLLDFGLAKLADGRPEGGHYVPDLTALPTTPPNLTAQGTILGTFQYMAPEQLEGKDADARTDIFAFGALLHEMLTGKKAFEGQSHASLIGAILKDEPPPISQVQPLAPPLLDRVVKKCLAKDLESRWHSAHDLHDELVWVAGNAGARDAGLGIRDSGAADRRARWTAPLVLTATAVVAALIGAAGVWWTARRGAPAQTDGVSLVDIARLTPNVGFSDWPTWSPNGAVFAFSSNRDGNFEIYVRQVEAGEDQNITKDPFDDVQPAYSPDGNSIAFVSTRSSRTGLIKTSATVSSFDYRTFGGDIWVMPALGGRAQRLAEDGNFPVWRPDGRAIAYVSGPESHRAILEVPEEGGAPKPLLPSSASDWEIQRVQYSPDGRWLTFETTDRKVLALSTGGGTPQDLLQGRSHAWHPTDQRVYYLNTEPAGGTRLFAAGIHETPGTLSATISPVWLVTGMLRDLAVSPDGRRILASELHESINVTRLELAPGGAGPAGLPEEELSTGQVRDAYPSMSPQGDRILLASNRLGKGDLWTLDLKSRGWEPIPMPEKACAIYQGSWAPEGRHVAASCNLPDGTLSVYRIALDGSEHTLLVSPKPTLGTQNSAIDLSPDGRSLLYGYLKEGFNQLFILDVASKRERQLTTSPSDKYDGRWSPDGRSIVFPSNDGGYVQAWKISAQGGKETALTSGDERMRYERVRHVFYSSQDGRWIYVQPSHRNIYRLPAEGGTPQQVTTFPESGLYIEEPTISPDGKYLVYGRGRGGSSLWLLTLGTPTRAILGTDAEEVTSMRRLRR